MAVTNAEIEKLSQKILSNQSKQGLRLDKVEVKLEEHSTMLYGDPAVRKDQGIIGVLNKIEELVNMIGSYIKPVMILVITSIVLSVAQKIAEIWVIATTVT